MKEEVAKLVVKSADGKLTISPTKLKALKKQAAAITSGEDLYALVMALGHTGIVLAEEKKSPAAAQVLYDLVKELTPKLKKLAKADGAKMKAQAARAVKGAAKLVKESQLETKGLTPKAKSGVGIRRK